MLSSHYTHIITREAFSHDTSHVQNIARGIRIITTKHFLYVPVSREIKGNNKKNLHIYYINECCDI